MIAESWLGTDANVVKALSAGIGVHHGGLPEAVRRAIENDFRAGLFPVLTATGTLAQGREPAGENRLDPYATPIRRRCR